MRMATKKTTATKAAAKATSGRRNRKRPSD